MEVDEKARYTNVIRFSEVVLKMQGRRLLGRQLWISKPTATEQDGNSVFGWFQEVCMIRLVYIMYVVHLYLR